MAAEREQIDVVLVDDEEIVRRGFRSVFDEDKTIRVVGEGASGHAALALAEQLNPDIIVMEVNLPGINGIEVGEKLLARTRPTKVVILTSLDFGEHLFRAIQAGASAFLLKSIKAQDLISAVKEVVAGGVVISPLMVRQLVDHFTILPPPNRKYYGDLLSELTDREIEILRAVGQGRSNREVARDLHLTTSTVKSHVSHVLSKLGLRDRVQAALLAHETGLVRFRAW